MKRNNWEKAVKAFMENDEGTRQAAVERERIGFAVLEKELRDQIDIAALQSDGVALLVLHSLLVGYAENIVSRVNASAGVQTASYETVDIRIDAGELRRVTKRILKEV